GGIPQIRLGTFASRDASHRRRSSGNARNAGSAGDRGYRGGQLGREILAVTTAPRAGTPGLSVRGDTARAPVRHAIAVLRDVPRRRPGPRRAEPVLGRVISALGAPGPRPMPGNRSTDLPQPAADARNKARPCPGA